MADDEEATFEPADPPPRMESDGSARTVDQWRDELFPAQGKRQHRALWQHNAASSLHGWSDHAFHANAPMQLSRADYDAALKAASTPDAAGRYSAHLPALSRFKGK